MDEKSLLGSYSSSADLQEEGAKLVFDGYHDGYDLTRLISHRFPHHGSREGNRNRLESERQFHESHDSSRRLIAGGFLKK